MLHCFLSVKPANDKLLKVCRSKQIPNRLTVDRRFQVMPIGGMISTAGNLSVPEKLVDGKPASVDSSLLKAKGSAWHKSGMKEDRIPIARIDTDANGVTPSQRAWMFGYRLRMSCSTGKLTVMLSADVSTSNTHDSKICEASVGSLAGLFQNVLADPVYGDKSPCLSSNKKKPRSINPTKQYPRTPPERTRLAEFYNSVICQELYEDRKIPIKPAFEYLKEMSDVRAVPVKGFGSVKSLVLICVLAYQLTVHYNYIIGVENPRVAKRMLCCQRSTGSYFCN